MRIEKNFIENHLPDVVVCYDKECRRIYINTEWERINEIPASMGLYKTPKEESGILNSSTAITYQKKLEDVLKAGLPTEWDIEFNKENKKYIYSIRAIPEYDKFNKLSCLLVTGRNITQRKEEEQQKLNEQIKFFFEKDLIGMFITTAKKDWLKANKKFCSMIGYSLDELKQMNWKNITHPYDLENSIQKFKSLVDGEIDEYTIKKRYIHKNNSIVFVKLLVSCMRDENNNVDSILVLAEDITNQIETQEKLEILNKTLEKKVTQRTYELQETVNKLHAEIIRRETQENIIEEYKNELESLANNLPDNIARFDMEGRYLYINPIHEKTLGMKASSILGKKINDLFPEHTNVIEAIKNIKNSNTPYEPVIIHQEVIKNNNIEIHEIKLILEKNNENKNTILGLGRDITKMMQMQKVLGQQKEKYRTLVDNAKVPIYRFDKNFKRLYVNPEVEKLVGKSYDELINKTPFEVKIIEDESIEKLKKAFDKVFETKQMVPVELKFILANDKRKYFIHNLIPEFDNKGEVESILAISYDLTVQKELATKEEKFRTLAENSPNIIMRYDNNCTRIYANKAFSIQTGIPYDLVVNTKPILQWGLYLEMLNINVNEYHKKIKQVFKTGISQNFIVEWIRKEGCLQLSYDLHLIAERDDNNEIIGVLAIGNDITERKKMENKILEQKNFQDSLLKGIAEAGLGVHVLENKKFIYTNNEILADDYGFSNSLSSDFNFLEIIHPDEREKLSLLHSQRLNGEDVPNTYTVSLIKKDGEKREHEVSVVLIPNTKPIQSIVVTKDITEKINIEKRIEFMAHHDALTKLPNRTLAKDRIEQLLIKANEKNEKFAILFVDLDGFKNINDSLGHSIGDEVLKLVAQRLRNCLRATDIISRQGGDEFLIILPNIKNRFDATLIANKIINSLKKSFEINNHTLSSTASIGIAFYPEHSDSYERLLQCADSAMYKAKENGKNGYCIFTQEMQHNLIGLFKMQNDLKDALINKEFILHYQPQVDIKNNKIIGAEALIRWKHPSLGMIPPINFISVAESMGLIVEIGEWVIFEACKQAAIWAKEGKKILVAVNISAIQFKRGNLLKTVKDALNLSGLNPKYLELELTESILINDTENVLETVRAIKKLGVQLSIDDFGTGYSSLAYLKRFAVDKLKIDQSFIKEIISDKDDETIVKTIIQMAKSFNLKTIAEGVESKEILELLKEFNCDEVQGYYFTKPLESVEFKKYYEKTFNEIEGNYHTRGENK